jgi:CRP-like cAMP-binding protein
MVETKSLINNCLLATLPSDEYQQLLPYLESIALSQDEVIQEQDQPIHFIYFPITAAISLLTTTEEDEVVELAMVGREGLVGHSIVLGFKTAPHRAIVQIAGTAMRINVDRFQRELKRCPILKQILLHYMYALTIQISRLVACNRFHKLDQRLCFLLLISHDRINSNTIPYTQEFLAYLLGSARSDINKTMTSLKQLKIIKYSRGQIIIFDRQGLENKSCKCYSAIKEAFDKFLKF